MDAQFSRQSISVRDETITPPKATVEKTAPERAQQDPIQPAVDPLSNLKAYPDFRAEIQRTRDRMHGIDERRPPIVVSVLDNLKIPGIFFRSDFQDYPLAIKTVVGNFMSHDTAQNLQFQRVWEILASRTHTMPGAIMLMTMLANPLVEAQQIEERRQALDLLKPGTPFRLSVDAYFKMLKKEDLWGRNRIDSAADLLDHNAVTPIPVIHSFWHGIKYGYFAARRYALFQSEIRKSLRKIVEGACSLPKSGSAVIDGIVSQLSETRRVKEYNLLKRPIYKSADGVSTSPQSKLYGWSLGHRIGKIDLQGKYIPLAVVVVGNYIRQKVLGGFETTADPGTHDYSPEFVRKTFIHLGANVVIAIGSAAAGIAWSMWRNKEFVKKVMPAFRDTVAKSPIGDVYSKLGELEALCALADHRVELLSQGWKDLALIDRPSFYCSVANFKNPIKEMAQPGKNIGNDFELLSGAIAGFSGPNSGGKSEFCLGLTWTILFAQAGLPAAADGGTISPVDKVFYHGPAFSGLNTEGRLGVELEKMRSVLVSATPRSLAIVDEAAGATEQKGGRRISSRIFWGLNRIGPGTIFVTHDFTFADRLERTGLLSNYHFGWENGEPTFKILNGVSTSSHSNRVARRQGVDKSGVVGILRRRGFLKENETGLMQAE